jgi:hypothetical protein
MPNAYKVGAETRAEQRKRYKKWSKRVGDGVKAKKEREIERHIKRYQRHECGAEQIEDFQTLSTDILTGRCVCLPGFHVLG